MQITPFKYLALIGLFFTINSFVFSYNSNLSLSSANGFEENKGQIVNDSGQVVSDVFFKTSIKGADLYVTSSGISYLLIKAFSEDTNTFISTYRVNLKLNNATIKKENITKINPLPGKKNYYLSHSPNGILNVNTYTKLQVTNVYPSIDWVLLQTEKGFKHEFIVKPGADYKNIEMLYEGIEGLRLENNDLFLITPLGEMKEGGLLTYQSNTVIHSAYDYQKIKEDVYRVNFNVSSYNKKESFVIDPPLELLWATYFAGGNHSERVNKIISDDEGNLYLTGFSTSLNYPLVKKGWAFIGVRSSVVAVQTIIAKFNNKGVLDWSTFYGGLSTGLTTESNQGMSIALDYLQNLYVIGFTSSAAIPLLDEGNGAYFQPTATRTFLLKFNTFGIRKHATYFGAGLSIEGSDIVCDNNANVYITGIAGNNALETRNSGGTSYFQSTLKDPNYGDLFYAKFNASFQLEHSTYFGGTFAEQSPNLSFNPDGNIYLVARTQSADIPPFQTNPLSYYQTSLFSPISFFIAGFKPNNECFYTSYFGGNGGEGFAKIASAPDSSLYITGYTWSATNFPIRTHAGCYSKNFLSNATDAFIARLNKNRALTWCTYFGGGYLDYANNLTVDECGNVYITGSTGSSNLDVIQYGGGSYFQGFYTLGTTENNGNGDLFIAAFNSNDTLIWSTYYNGINPELATSIALNNKSQLYISGHQYYKVSGEPSGLQTKDLGGGAFYEPNNDASIGQAFLLKFDAVNNCETIELTKENITCNGYNNGKASVEINGPAVSTSNYSYSWSPVGVTNQSVDNLQEGIYDLTVTNTNTGKIHTRKFSIIQPPAVTVVSSIDLTVCSGTQTVLTAQATGKTTPFKYHWNNRSYTGNPYVFRVDTSGNYIVEVEDSVGCIKKDTVAITAIPLPVLETSTATRICLGDSTTLNATGALNYIWLPMQGLNTTTGSIVNAHPSNSTTYVVRGYNDYEECYTEEEIFVDVITEGESCIPIYIPNAFTPNGKEPNDVFKVFSNYPLSDFNFKMYDRWGNLFYETNDQSKGWDGKYNGYNCIEDVYLYVINYSENNNPRQCNGFVVLIR